MGKETIKIRNDLKGCVVYREIGTLFIATELTH